LKYGSDSFGSPLNSSRSGQTARLSVSRSRLAARTLASEPLAPGPKIPVYYLRFGSYTIWGATARMLLNLIEVVQPVL